MLSNWSRQAGSSVNCMATVIADTPPPRIATFLFVIDRFLHHRHLPSRRRLAARYFRTGADLKVEFDPEGQIYRHRPGDKAQVRTNWMARPVLQNYLVALHVNPWQTDQLGHLSRGFLDRLEASTLRINRISNLLEEDHGDRDRHKGLQDVVAYQGADTQLVGHRLG